MIGIVLILIVAVIWVAKRLARYFLQQQKPLAAKAVVGVMLLIQLVLVYYFMKMMMTYILRLLNIFYNQ
ncbi:hypothetical protein BU015_10610 [Staphylococcus simulans]|uniref:hypothetical protein n=1 Tax=Staphylococcus simulans TaxID=1286 RepID=UPI000E69425E|nr:hypothetical protein [Staphylococcus simulans]RIN75239.1 hypothetical protein BU015_10610 [Staphylococcus simulans]